MMEEGFWFRRESLCQRQCEHRSLICLIEFGRARVPYLVLSSRCGIGVYRDLLDEMQIFFNKTSALDVEALDTVGVVKMKIQASIKIFKTEGTSVSASRSDTLLGDSP